MSESGKPYVVNAGTVEHPNFFGSAEEMGKLQGIRAAIGAAESIEIGAGSEHYRHGRETMLEDVLKMLRELLP